MIQAQGPHYGPAASSPETYAWAVTTTYGELVGRVREAQGALEQTLAELTEEQARAASNLQGWSRGHLITHLARNADAMTRFARGAARGGPGPQMYPGGPDARAAAIEEGAGRPVGLLLDDLRFAGRRAVDEMAVLPESALEAMLNWKIPVPARMMPVLRLRELEIHHVDLDLGYGPADWPVDFVEHTLESELPALEALVLGFAAPDLPRHELLAWLLGRPMTAGLPELPAWPF